MSYRPWARQRNGHSHLAQHHIFFVAGAELNGQLHHPGKSGWMGFSQFARRRAFGV